MSRPAVGKIAKVAIAVVVVFVALIAIGAAIGPQGTRQTTSSQAGVASTATSRQSSQSSSSQTSSAEAIATGALNIAVTGTAVDQTTTDASSGYTIYIYDVTITDTASASHLSDELYFTLIGADNSVYNLALDIAEKQQLPSVTLNHGQQASGQIAFQVPNNEQPAKLEYHNPTESIDEFVTNLPQPTQWVSSVVLAQASFQNTTVSNDYYVSAEIQNSTTGLYYSTDTIPVEITVTSLGDSFISYPNISITSVTISNQGFAIAGTTPTLPITVDGNGQVVNFIVNLTLPQASVSVNTLNLTLVTTGT